MRHRTECWAMIVSLGCTVGIQADVICNRFEGQLNPVAGGVVISLITDLPDDTKIHVLVGRTYTQSDGTSQTINQYQEDSVVAAWRSPQLVFHENWRTCGALASTFDLMKQLGQPVQIAAISELVSVRFLMAEQQTNARFGPANSRLRGSAVTQYTPTGKPAIAVADWIGSFRDPLEGNTPELQLKGVPKPAPLSLGTSYLVTEKTPLLREVGFPRRRFARTQLEMIPVGGSFVTRKSLWKDDGNWYQVEAFSPSGKSISTGWLKSDSLLEQRIHGK